MSGTTIAVIAVAAVLLFAAAVGWVVWQRGRARAERERLARSDARVADRPWGHQPQTRTIGSLTGSTREHTARKDQREGDDLTDVAVSAGVYTGSDLDTFDEMVTGPDSFESGPELRHAWSDPDPEPLSSPEPVRESYCAPTSESSSYSAPEPTPAPYCPPASDPSPSYSSPSSHDSGFSSGSSGGDSGGSGGSGGGGSE